MESDTEVEEADDGIVRGSAERLGIVIDLDAATGDKGVVGDSMRQPCSGNYHTQHLRTTDRRNQTRNHLHRRLHFDTSLWFVVLNSTLR